MTKHLAGKVWYNTLSKSGGVKRLESTIRISDFCVVQYSSFSEGAGVVNNGVKWHGQRG
jgi:hypothetical protein